MKKNMLARLSKISITSFSLVFMAVFSCEPFASGIADDVENLPAITLPTSTVSQVNYSNAREGQKKDSAELTIEAYIDAKKNVESIASADVMVLFDQSEQDLGNKNSTVKSIKNILEKLPDSNEENDTHRICLMGYGEMNNTGYYTYADGPQFNQAVPNVNIWNEQEDSSFSLPGILSKYSKKLPSYEKCFISKSNALQVLKSPEKMGSWGSAESRADAGLVLASKFIRQRNIALTPEERESRPLIVIFASSSVPTQLVDGEKISRADLIKPAVDELKTVCSSYGVTPNIYSIGDSDSEGFDKMMLDVAGAASHRFSAGSASSLTKAVTALVKSKNSNPDTQEIEITASKFKDPNGEEKTFAELKDQYHFDFDNAVIKRYTLKENKNGEKIWKEDPESVTSQKVSATDDVISCRVSVDETAQLATYSSEAGSTTTDPPKKVVVTVTSSDEVKITINTDLPESERVYYVEWYSTGGTTHYSFYIRDISKHISWSSSDAKEITISEITPPGYKLTGIYVGDTPVENGKISTDEDCTITFKHEKKDAPVGLTHQVIRNNFKLAQ